MVGIIAPMTPREAYVEAYRAWFDAREKATRLSAEADEAWTAQGKLWLDWQDANKRFLASESV